MNFDCDLICLVADGNMKATMKALLKRHLSFSMRPISIWQNEPLVHPQHDPGCFKGAEDFLRPFLRRAHRALVILDREGCGRQAPRIEIEADVERRLSTSGWQGRAAAIVIDPELESWIFSPSIHVTAALGWEVRFAEFRSWLIESGFLEQTSLKPECPKEALESALRRVRKPRSSSIYRQLAAKVSFQKCEDPSFIKLRETLVDWFPAIDEHQHD